MTSTSTARPRKLAGLGYTRDWDGRRDAPMFRALDARLGTATGADRLLDRYIWVRLRGGDPLKPRRRRQPIARLTGSLDQVMLLKEVWLPEWRILLEEKPEGLYSATLALPSDPENRASIVDIVKNPPRVLVACSGATAPLAALRAVVMAIKAQHLPKNPES